MPIDRKTLQEHENRILCGLVDFYYERGYTSRTYADPEVGGIYEHKLATLLGYKLQRDPDIDPKIDAPPPEFFEAAQLLQDAGYVRRMKRRDDYPILGIWPTPRGLERVEFLKADLLGRARITLGNKVDVIFIALVTSAATTVVTLLVASLFGVFGLG